MSYLLDTNICIYAIKNKPERVLLHLKKKREEGLFISAITLAELQFGVAKSAFPEKNTAALLRFLSIMEVLDFDDLAAVEYGRIRAFLEKTGATIGSLDMLIAAHARSENHVLVTNNIKEFQRVPKLRLENWTA